jgi:hypothetical protein
LVGSEVLHLLGWHSFICSGGFAQINRNIGSGEQSPIAARVAAAHSHSIVPGGFDVMA